MSTEHPNLELIHAFFKAYAANDAEGFKKVFSPDIEWHIPGRHPLSGTKKGIGEVLDYFSQLGAFSFQAKPLVMGVNDDYVIDCHLNWSNLENGENLERLSCLLWMFRDGKIFKVYNFPEDQHVVDAFFNSVISGI